MSWSDDPGKKGDGTVPIRFALARLLRARGIEAAAVLAEVRAVWDEVAGPEAAPHISPRSLRGDELIVEVDHPAWATQVQLSSAELLGRLAERLGPSSPRKISAQVVPPGRGPRS